MIEFVQSQAIDSQHASTAVEESRKYMSLAASVDVRSKVFKANFGSKQVLSNLRFDVGKHEFLTILGPSGCGKTTLLRIIAGLDTDFEGTVVVQGHRVLGPGRNRGLMFQESRLLPWLKVWQNVAFALPPDVPKSERRAIVSDVLRSVGLSEYEYAWPSQLSGGMAKRVALARSIANVPYLLLLDEPLTALDTLTKYALQDEIRRIHSEKEKMTTILVTHDIDEAVYLSDRILVLSPSDSHVLVEIRVPLEYPRSRIRNDFHDLCSHVSKTIFELWWKDSLKPGTHRNCSNESV